MAKLISKVRREGGSTWTTIPAEVVQGMGLDPGDGVLWIAEEGGYRVVKATPERLAAIAAHDEVTDEYRDVFARLASD